jgi:hypothetical protein
MTENGHIKRSYCSKSLPMDQLWEAPGKMQGPIGTVRSYDDLLAVARARMAHLSITFETLDDTAGVAPGYSAKLLGPNPSRRFGTMSFGAVMGALGLQFIAIEDAAALARVQPRLVKRLYPPRQRVPRTRPTIGRSKWERNRSVS